MNKYDFYDYDKMEELRDGYHKTGVDLFRRLYNAKEKGNQRAAERARKALVKHEAKGKKMKERAEEAGFYWY